MSLKTATAILISSVAALGLVPGASAQAPVLSETIEVRVASVDAVVIDASGARVGTLKADDFEVWENGEKREITNFAAPSPASAGAAPRRAGRRIVFYFDNTSLSLAYRKELIAAAKQFARTAVGPDDRVMIASWNRAFAIRLPWTADAAAIDAALDQVANETPAASQREAEKRRIESMINDIVRADATPTTGAAPMIGFDSLMDSARRYATSEQIVAKQSILALDALVGNLAGIDGRKVVVVASEWMPAQPGSELFQHLEQVKQQIDTNSGSSSRMKSGSKLASPISEMSRYSVTEHVEKLKKSAAANRVTLYAASAMFGERSGSNVDYSDGGTSSDGGGATALDGLRTVVAASGGQAYVGMKPDLALKALAGDLDNAYSLGFRTKAQLGALTRLEVRVRNPELKVRSQRSFVAKPLEQEMEERVLANHVQPPATNDLAILARHSDITQTGGRRKVPLLVMIPVERLSLKQEGDMWSGAFSVFLSSATAKGETTPVTIQTHEFRWTQEQMTQLAKRAIGFGIDVVVEPAVDRISVGVLDRASSLTGFQTLELPR